MSDTINYDLESLKTRIDKMSKQQHIDILRIMKQDPNITINANKSGVYINLSFLPQIIVDEIVQYIQHVDTQESVLKPNEQQKETYKNSFFGAKDNKDDALYYSSISNNN
jgi:hypothetical protein